MPPSVPMRARYHPRGEAASENRPPAPTHVICRRRDCQRRRSRRPCITAMTDRPRERIAIYTTYGKRGTRAFRMSSSATGYCSERPRDTAPGQHGRRGGIRTRGRCFAPRTTGRPRRCRHGRPCGERAAGPPPSAAVLFDLVEGLLPGLTRVVIGLEGGAAMSELGGLRLREGRGRRLKAIPETLGEFDALGGAQVREVEQRVGHARNPETATGCSK
jgi:hypothetical protein